LIQFGKLAVVRQFCKPGKVGEFEIWSGKFFMTITGLVFENKFTF